MKNKKILAVIDECIWVVRGSQFHIGVEVLTDDGYTGKITAGESGKWKVRFDADMSVLKKQGKKKHQFYEPDQLSPFEETTSLAIQKLTEVRKKYE